MKVITIIVPIYNMEHYLGRCLDSILSQGIGEGTYEVLLINDGSTDNSLAICEQYRNQYPQIFRVISKQNEGVSATRNLGIEEAKGYWLYFMDADDYLVPGGLSSVMGRYLDDSVDMLSFSSVTLKEQEHCNIVQKLSPNYNESNSVIKYEGIDSLREYKLNTFIFNTIIKRSVMVSGKASHVRFEKMYIAEDFLFKFECALCRCRERVVSDCIYHYIIRDFSAITNRSKERMKEAIPCFMRCFQRLGQVAEEWKDDEKMKNALMYLQTRLVTPFFSRVLSANLSHEQFVEVMRNMRPHMSLVREGTVKKLMRFFIKAPALYPLASFAYRFFFMTIVYPFLHKN